MKHVLLWAVIAVGAGFSSTAALSRFEKVTERFYYLPRSAQTADSPSGSLGDQYSRARRPYGRKQLLFGA